MEVGYEPPETSVLRLKVLGCFEAPAAIQLRYLLQFSYTAEQLKQLTSH